VFRIEVAAPVAPEGGLTYDCAAGESLLVAAERQGWELPFSCRSGVCGSCEGEVVAGEFRTPGRVDPGPLHHGPAERVRLCQVRPCSDLVIAPRSVRRRDLASQRVINAKVLRIEKPASEVAVLKLRFPAGTRAKFRAGQYLKVLLDDGQERCFSMANAPQQNDGVELHVRLLSGGRFSGRISDGLAPGDVVQLRLPLGDFHLREVNPQESSRALVFVAGGTGFAPIQSIVEDLLRQRSTRPVRLYVGARTRELLYGDAQARAWAERHPDLVYVPVISSPEPGDAWAGRTGLVHEAVLEDLPTLDQHEVYACGAPAMLDAARAAFERRGLAPAHFHCDAFVPSQELAA
jgi:CDP-4-dehydro-6-deoxyglucose reductase/3-phenylpropionate/trans-cinnamate dioxygenase ferredoxin reductase subunit